MRPQSLMNFALRCVRIFPGVKKPCGISNPRPGLTPGTALRAVGSGINGLRDGPTLSDVRDLHSLDEAS